MCSEIRLLTSTFGCLFCICLLFLSFGQDSIWGQDRGRGNWRSEDRRDNNNQENNRERWNRRGEDQRGDNRNSRGGNEDRGGGDQRWNPAEFIERLDTNGNGRIDPSEVSGRAERYLQDLGFDTNTSIPIGQIIGRIEGRGSDRQSQSGSQTAKVPGFGAINEPVLSLGAMASTQLDKMFSPAIVNRVTETMDRYDRNGDGVLDEEEIQRVNWGSPPWQQSDLDGDGKLSRLELAYRYRAREAIRMEDPPQRRSERSNRSERETVDREDRGMFNADPPSQSSSTRSRRGNTRERTDTTRSTANSSRDRSDSSSDQERRGQTESWVDSMMERYDTDKDGKLSAEEVQAMRNPPKLPSSGFITRDEYVTYLLNGSKWPEEETSSIGTTSDGTTNRASDRTTARASDRTTTRDDTSRNTADAGRAGSRFSRGNRGVSGTTDRGSVRGDSSRNSQSNKTTFEDFDTNGNGIIEMHEFSEQWSEEKLEEFYQIDTNQDGVISRREWQAAGRR